MLTLVGIVIVVIGFVLRINPLLVVTVAGLATGIASGLGPLAVVAAFGKAFMTSRYVAIVWLLLPVIGLLEHAGLKERARAVVAGLRAATTSRVLLVYFTDSPDHRRSWSHLAGRPRADGAPANRADGGRSSGESVR